MSLKISEFNALEFLERFLGAPSEQNKLSDSESFDSQNTTSQTDFGFQEKSLLGGNVYQARFNAAQNTQRTTQVTATSSASVLARDPRVRAMLDVLGFTEGTGNNYGKVVNGTVLSAPGHPELVGRRNISIDDFSRHPNIMVQVRPGLNSSAAGRYQFLSSTWRGLGMPDFTPQSQDIAAVKLMQQRGMIEPLLRGDIRTAVFRGAPEWASLPKNAQNQGYYSGQSARTLHDILDVYTSSLRRHQQGQGTTPAPTQPHPTTPTAPTVGTLSRGEHNNAVKTLQNELVKLGHLTQAQMNTGPGIFGRRTENAVKDFQRDNHLPVTGRWDSASQHALKQILGIVKRGDHGSVVRGVQEQLVRTGFMTRAQMNTGPGIFGRRTEAALKNFQAAHHLVPDGKLGPLTYRALQAASAARPQQPTPPTQPTQPTAPVNGKTYTYQPWATYSSGAGGVRHVTNYNQLLPHHDYQHVTRGGQRLEVRDVVLTRPGQNNNGQTLPSPLEGRVVNIRHQGSKGYGNSIEVVNDRTGERFLVGHLSRVDVHVGQHVSYGQPIGAQGSTGHSTGPHVHIESESHVIRRWVNDLVDGKFDGK
jgi:muramidase (phage lysozyme)/peptidoglycan hydrolase-like protein with peptidoglycan-binding domain